MELLEAKADAGEAYNKLEVDALFSNVSFNTTNDSSITFTGLRTTTLNALLDLKVDDNELTSSVRQQ